METTQTVKILGRFIVVDPKVCHGQPTFRGTRIFVRFRAAFQHSDRHSGRNEEQGRGQSGRSASNNDDAGVTHETA